jgi:hypothetical protein
LAGGGEDQGPSGQDYVDPPLAADKVQKLVEPKIPKSSDVKEGAVSFADLTDDDLKKLQQLQRAVKLELREFELVR